jgi:hypothetical protein
VEEDENTKGKGMPLLLYQNKLFYWFFYSFLVISIVESGFPSLRGGTTKQSSLSKH